MKNCFWRKLCIRPTCCRKSESDSVGTATGSAINGEVKPGWTLRQCGRAEPWWVDPAHWSWTLLRLSFTQRFAWCGLTGTQVHGRPGRWLCWVVQISSCSRGQEVDSHVAFVRATPLIPSPKWRSCFPPEFRGVFVLSRGLELTFVGAAADEMPCGDGGW